MKYSIEITKQCLRDIKKYKNKHFDMKKFYEVLEYLQNGNTEILRNNYRDHSLKGEWKGFRELHIDNDWLLVYMIENNHLIITLTRMGSHDDLGLN